MSESGDYDPGVWRGHDFDRAYRDFDQFAGRSYDDAKALGKMNEDLLPRLIKTLSSSPLSIVSDTTGSMGDRVGVFFSKLPYLELEGQEYLGKDMEICFAAVGDAYCDTYYLQARPFDKGTNLKDRIKELVTSEHGGGGQHRETYELAALYFLNNVEMPNAIRPILIFIGDEMPYETVLRDMAIEKCYANLETNIPTSSIFAQLKTKFSVYMILGPYGTDRAVTRDDMDPATEEIYKEWLKYLPADRIAYLPDPQRVVDVIFGILAKETNRVEYFREEIEGRQKPGQVEIAYKSLKTIHAVSSGDPVPSLTSGNSVMRVDSNAPKSQPLK